MAKILFSVCGEGLGHFGRSLSIIKKLQKKHTVKVMTYGLAKKMFKQEANINTIDTLPDYQSAFTETGGVDLKRTTDLGSFFKRGTQASLLERKIINQEKPDLIVSDGKLSTLTVAGIKGVKNIFITNQISTYRYLDTSLRSTAIKGVMPFFNRLAGSTISRILVSDFPKPYDLSSGLVDITAPMHKIEHVGPTLMWDKVERASKEKTGNVFFTLSGVGLGTDTMKNVVKVAEGTKFKFIILNNTDIKLEKHESIKEIRFPSYEEMYDIFSKTDVYMGCPGWALTTEALAFGIPLIATYPEDHLERKRIVENIERYGLGINAGTNPSHMDMIKYLRKIFTTKSYFENAMKYHQLYKFYNGAQRSAEIINEVLEE
ncbi:MAG: hypothetical protein JXA43_02785 [Candidatus Diapherotrites archaeon]|nr:hypothetical protein [Candidatus Diapherotrites archaeon]